MRDYWISPAVTVVVRMRSLGLTDDQLIELILLGGYQTSWLRYYQIGSIMFQERCITNPFETYIRLAMEKFGSITGGVYKRCEPPGIDVNEVYLKERGVLNGVVQCIMNMLEWINACQEEVFDSAAVRMKVQETSCAISEVNRRTELGEFRLMTILQICALSSVRVRPSPKLLNLLYPIPGKGSARHLIEAGVSEAEHPAAMKRVVHHFDLSKFGSKAGESLLCESLPGCNVFDVFLRGQDLFLMDHGGVPHVKRYNNDSWEVLGDVYGHN